MSFSNGQMVSGKVAGKFVVVKSEVRRADGAEVVTVKEVGPNGQLSSRKMKLPADALVAA